MLQFDSLFELMDAGERLDAFVSGSSGRLRYRELIA